MVSCPQNREPCDIYLFTTKSFIPQDKNVGPHAWYARLCGELIGLWTWWVSWRIPRRCWKDMLVFGLPTWFRAVLCGWPCFRSFSVCNHFGQFMLSTACGDLTSWHMSNIMPPITAALRYVVAGSFRMDAAEPDVQLQQGRQVPWTDSFIDDIKRSLLTCRVLCVHASRKFYPISTNMSTSGSYFPFTGFVITRPSTIWSPRLGK